MRLAAASVRRLGLVHFGLLQPDLVLDPADFSPGFFEKGSHNVPGTVCDAICGQNRPAIPASAPHRQRRAAAFIARLQLHKHLESRHRARLSQTRRRFQAQRRSLVRWRRLIARRHRH